jgi:hypothetical protein
MFAYQSSGRRGNRLVEHLLPTSALHEVCFASSADSLGFVGHL